MIVKIEREHPAPPPVNKVTLELTPQEFRNLQYLVSGQNYSYDTPLDKLLREIRREVV